MTLFAALSAGAKTYLLCNFSIFLFSAFTERLGGCLYKCGCVVKFSILMSTIRKNSSFQSLRSKSAIKSSSVISSQIGVLSYQLRVSLYMVMSKNIM